MSEPGGGLWGAATKEPRRRSRTLPVNTQRSPCALVNVTVTSAFAYMARGKLWGWLSIKGDSNWSRVAVEVTEAKRKALTSKMV